MGLAKEHIVLVVDDETEIRRVVTKVFKRNFPEARLHEAQDGLEAGQLILDTLPDLVILDLKIPGADGFKICGNIRSDRRFRNTKILAITGQDTQEYKNRVLGAGADDYLPKPFEVKVLLEKSSRLLDFPESIQ